MKMSHHPICWLLKMYSLVKRGLWVTFRYEYENIGIWKYVQLYHKDKTHHMRDHFFKNQNYNKMILASSTPLQICSLVHKEILRCIHGHVLHQWAHYRVSYRSNWQINLITTGEVYRAYRKAYEMCIWQGRAVADILRLIAYSDR